MIRDVLWGAPDEQTPIDVHEVEIPIADGLDGAEGLRIAVVSDLHFGRIVSAGFAARVVRITNELQPDIIVLLGDMIDRNQRHIGPCAEILADLRAPAGVFGCLGNHDHRAGGRHATEAFAAAGVDMLNNEHRRVRHGSVELIIAGVDDATTDRSDPAAATAGVDGRAPVILLSHNPDAADDLGGVERIDLMLCGHTHGGQIRLFGRAPITGIRNRAYACGLAHGPRCPVYTSRGLGFTRLPLRVDCRPELPVIRLVAAR